MPTKYKAHKRKIGPTHDPNQRSPQSNPRSQWEEFDPNLIADQLRQIGATVVRGYRRRVGDGTLQVIITQSEKWGWHLSISFVDHRGSLSRYPRWDEIADARYTLLADDLVMCMLLPPPDRYVSLHDTTFQVVEHNRGQIGVE